MKIETIRRRMAHMEVRLQRDLVALEKIFPRVDWNDAHVGTEAIRNLATAVSYIQSFQAMSDFGIEAEINAHQYAPKPEPRRCDCVSPPDAEWAFCRCERRGVAHTNGERDRG